MDDTADKDALLLATLANVPFDGWSIAAMRAGARAAGMDEATASALFPRGGVEMVEWFSAWADRAMLEHLAGTDLVALKVREDIERVRELGVLEGV